MATEFKLPELGENIESGDLIKILVSVGDRVEKDQPVIELETEKATIEVPSPVSGTVKEIHVKAGQKIKVGQLVLTVEDGAAGKAEAKAEKKAEPVPAARVEKAKTAMAPAAVEEAKEEETKTAVPAAAPPAPPPRPEAPREVAPAAPSVRRLARELG